MTSSERNSGATGDGESLLAITLCASNAPIPMPTLKDERLRGFALFKSRRVEDGRERHRLHLGYFMNSSEAERVLAILRPAYPGAMIATVPQGSMGSLENTSMTRFSILQPTATASTPPEPASIAVARVTVLSEVPKATPVSVPAPRPSAAPFASPPILPLSAVISRAPAAAEPAPVPQSRPAVQRYAVQLAFGREPIDISKLPQLAIYEGYLLYAIETEPGGRRLYGVRLGFYDDALSARLVAQYVRSEFKDVAIVPVSEREVARATTAKIRLPSVRTARASATSLPLWPRSALTVTFNPGSHLSLVT